MYFTKNNRYYLKISKLLMLFLQLSINPAASSFKHSTWIEYIQAEFPKAETIEVDNYSELYLYQHILNWVLKSDAPLALHIQCIDSEAPTGAMFRFLQELFQKKIPVCITVLGKHAGIEKYIKAFAEYKVVETEKEALALLSLKRGAEDAKLKEQTGIDLSGLAGIMQSKTTE
ncbi:hypothetical protein CHU_0698 [Cytophaga hutchinsonii ATCC 33406]|uniref:Uncharacterized protein n=2 Tax=Cytophaga hutchinsonii TaxID=985 RepID=A0A6N4SNV0_CYTH3|nr:hypothetical protein CHU_0698 [Cytophaga hutchinsonii ATCC 33406]